MNIKPFEKLLLNATKEPFCEYAMKVPKPITRTLKGKFEFPTVTEVIGDTCHFSHTSKGLDAEWKSIISLDEAKSLMHSQKLRRFSAKDKIIQLEVGGEKISAKFIGGGGSKTAYSFSVAGEEHCLLLTDLESMNEVQNNHILQNIGLLTRDSLQICPVKIEGNTYPAMIGKPFEKHGFNIIDVKHPSTYLDNCIDMSRLNHDNLKEFLSGVLSDIKKLTDNKVALGYDAINLAVKDNQLRLFFMDLPYRDIISTGDYNVQKYQKKYLEYVIDHIQNLSSPKFHQKSGVTLDDFGDYFKRQKIIEQLL